MKPMCKSEATNCKNIWVGFASDFSLKEKADMYLRRPIIQGRCPILKTRWPFEFRIERGSLGFEEV
jgi:hypothetical protein